ncbi:unnamed protein product, partial [Prorocentrum cordatum]
AAPPPDAAPTPARAGSTGRELSRSSYSTATGGDAERREDSSSAERRELDAEVPPRRESESVEFNDRRDAMPPSSPSERSCSTVNKYEQAINVYADIGGTGLIENTRLKLEATSAHIKDMRTPATSHKQCAQKLEKANDKEETVLGKEVAARAAKLGGGKAAEEFVEVPEDVLQLGPESSELKSDPGLLQFYRSFAFRTSAGDLTEAVQPELAAARIVFDEVNSLRWDLEVHGLSMKRGCSATAPMPGRAEGARFMDTCNANQGNQTLQKRLLQTESLIVLAQEIGYHGWECEALSAWASDRRWNVTIVPGAPAEGKLPSAGLCIFAREGQGMTIENVKIRMNVGLAMAGRQRPSLIGGGWYMPAAEAEASTVTATAQLSLPVPTGVTCRAATANAAVDLFAPAAGMMRLVQPVKADLEWAVKPHRPVIAAFSSRGNGLVYLACVGGDKLSQQKDAIATLANLKPGRAAPDIVKLKDEIHSANLTAFYLKWQWRVMKLKLDNMYCKRYGMQDSMTHSFTEHLRTMMKTFLGWTSGYKHASSTSMAMAWIRPATLRADSKGAINLFQQVAQDMVQVTQRYGGVFGFAHSLGVLNFIQDVKHIKARRSGEGYSNLDAATKRITDGSVVADRFVELGAAGVVPDCTALSTCASWFSSRCEPLLAGHTALADVAPLVDGGLMPAGRASLSGRGDWASAPLGGSLERVLAESTAYANNAGMYMPSLGSGVSVLQGGVSKPSGGDVSDRSGWF